MRLASPKKQTQQEANTPYRFTEIRHQSSKVTIVVPRVSSENRPYLPMGLIEGETIIGDRNFALFDAPPLEHGAYRLAPALGLDWHSLRADAH